jgi:hypothetical protein
MARYCDHKGAIVVARPATVGHALSYRFSIRSARKTDDGTVCRRFLTIGFGRGGGRRLFSPQSRDQLGNVLR